MASRVRRKLSTRTATVASILIGVVWTIPTFGLFISSWRPEEEIKTNGWWKAFGDPALTLDNYQQVVFGTSGASGRLASYFVNSVVISVPAVLFSVCLAAMAAYALSWVDFRGRDWIFIGVFVLQIVPLQVALIPLLQLLGPAIGWGGGFFAAWVAHTCFGLPFGVFLLHNFMSEVPKTISESVRIDGGTHATTFRRIVIPLVAPALASLTIFQFLWIWNDLLVALVFTSGPNTRPLTVRLAELAGTRGNEWQRLTSGAFVSMVIPLVVFLTLQRYFVRGLLTGGVKG
ncbi:carbohydrate ABC transporter permease [Dactylosporangium aurantiacum]|uniref:Carbohydrate ABC transporter permease n=2 Tax=Dactylosporangium aurantiacum TaxID=35754 RepID=A0A9Q9IQW5_9ACTN|nr:carbohydrate ABC transporter permease [Dactylosporangium aurantiacum]MDG6110018.1 carbohydrate ABC transporter permease [Dactylosporangium aurantiacum]UWZ59658.1 carbohydrate ABC transporter permease [Dactylosporangium aurantiacum]